MSMVSHQFSHVIGVDTHAKTHTLVVLDHLGARHGAAQAFPTTVPGLKRAHAWIARETTGPILVAMEGTGSYGAQFCDHLTAAGVRVTETKPPKHGVRRSGKTDAIDAEHAARFALGLTMNQLITPRNHSGSQSALTVLLMARRALTTARTATNNSLTALLRGYGLGIDARNALTLDQVREVASWRARPSDDIGLATIRAEAVREAVDVLHRDAELNANRKGLRQHVLVLAPQLFDEYGIGDVVAAQILVSWSHPGRIRSEASFARFAGIAPIPASSGNTVRYRLDRGGDRALNSAIWTTAFQRYHHDPRTAAYVVKKTNEGKTPKEIQRLLKRYIIRHLFRVLESNAT